MAKTKTPTHASNLGHIPMRDVGSWCQDVIQRCTYSRGDRIRYAQTMRNFYWSGTDDGAGAVDNEIFPTIDQLASSLFSPQNPRFTITFDRTNDPEQKAIGQFAAEYLSRDFHRRGVDQAFAAAVNWGLIDASCFIKLLWNRQGFDPYIVAQGFMGVFHEGLPGLDRQDAFVHTSFMTLATFERSIQGHPEADKILRTVRRKASLTKTDVMSQQDIRTLLIGGTIPVNLTPPQSNIPGGWVNWVKGPRANIDAGTLAELIQLDELWVIDNDKEDYTTFQLVGDIVIEGKLQRRNLCGIKGEHPFTQVCPNSVIDYFWGRSEVAQLMLAQNAITAQVNGISRTMRMQEDPPMTFKGIGSGNIDQKRSTLMKPGGRLAETNPQFEVKNEAPKLAEQSMPFLEFLGSNFHRQSGFEAPVSRGMGEQGIRSGVHGETMVRMSSQRQRDRALDVERTYAELGDYGLQLNQAHVPDEFTISYDDNKTTTFILKQIADDYNVEVDSHSSSPSFSEESRSLAFRLAQAKAIDDEGLIRLTHPPQEDNLIAEVEKRRRKQAEFIAAHPEALKPHGQGRR